MQAETTISLTDSLAIYKSMVATDAELRSQIWDMSGDAGWWSLIDTAYAIALILSLLMVARISYRMMALQGKLDILELLRPIFVSIVLANWYSIIYPLTELASSPEGVFRHGYERNVYVADSLRKLRNLKQDSLGMICVELQGSAEALALLEREIQGEKSVDEDKVTGVVKGETVLDILSTEAGNIYNDYDASAETARKYMERLETSRLIERGALWIGEALWEMAVFFIFIVKNVMLHVLVWFGPIVIACTLLERWKDEWIGYIGKVITVCLYGTAAYLVMAVTMRIIIFGLAKEISMVDLAMKDQEGIFNYVLHTIGGGIPLTLTIIAQFAGTVALLGVPAMMSLFFPAATITAASGLLHGMYSSTLKQGENAVKLAWETTKALVTLGASKAAGAASVSGKVFRGESRGDGKRDLEYVKGLDPADDRTKNKDNTTESKPLSGESKTSKKPDVKEDYMNTDRKLDELLEGKIAYETSKNEADERTRYEKIVEQLDKLGKKIEDNGLDSGKDKNRTTDKGQGTEAKAVKSQENLSANTRLISERVLRGILEAAGMGATLLKNVSLHDALVTEKDGCIRIVTPYVQWMVDALKTAKIPFDVKEGHIEIQLVSEKSNPGMTLLSVKEMKMIAAANGEYSPGMLEKLLLPGKGEYSKMTGNYTKEMLRGAAKKVSIIAATSIVLSPVGALLLLWTSRKTLNVLRSVDAFGLRKPTKTQKFLLRMGHTVYVKGGLLSGDSFLYMHNGKVYTVRCDEVSLPSRIGGVTLSDSQREALRKGQLVSVRTPKGQVVSARVDLSCPDNVRIYVASGQEVSADMLVLERYRRAESELDRLLREQTPAEKQDNNNTTESKPSGSGGESGDDAWEAARQEDLENTRLETARRRDKMAADISLMSMEALDDDPYKEVRKAARNGYWNRQQAESVRGYLEGRAREGSFTNGTDGGKRWNEAITELERLMESGKFRDKRG